MLNTVYTIDDKFSTHCHMPSIIIEYFLNTNFICNLSLFSIIVEISVLNSIYGIQFTRLICFALLLIKWTIVDSHHIFVWMRKFTVIYVVVSHHFRSDNKWYEFYSFQMETNDKSSIHREQHTHTHLVYMSFRGFCPSSSFFPFFMFFTQMGNLSCFICCMNLNATSFIFQIFEHSIIVPLK